MREAGEASDGTLEAEMETDNQHPLEDYFEFLSPDDIRIKGTRVGIENMQANFETRDHTFRRKRPERTQGNRGLLIVRIQARTRLQHQC